MKLISMTDFVLEQTELLYEKNQSKLIHRVVNYAQFLKQPSKLGMFVPCDEEGNVLEEPIISEYLLDSPGGIPIKSKNTPEAYYYRKAKERVLFEGWKIIHQDKVRITIECDCFQLDWAIAFNSFGHYAKIENLSHLNFEITQSAIKQIGL